MPPKLPFIKKTPQGIQLSVHVVPGSKKNGFAGMHAEALKLKLTAPPVDGAANKMCIKFLSAQLKIPKANITIISGLTHREKKLLLKQDETHPADDLVNRLQHILSVSIEKSN